MSERKVVLGLRANWQQFTLLLVVNAFVGAMVGLERTVVPLIAQQDFGLVSNTVVLSFIVTFGLVKALANSYCWGCSSRFSSYRRPMAMLARKRRSGLGDGSAEPVLAPH